MQKFIITLAALSAFCLSGISAAVQTSEAESTLTIDNQTRNLVIQSKRKFAEWNNPEGVQENLTLAVITDLHGDAENLARFIGACDGLGSLIDGRIELGDIVPNWFGQDFEFYKNTPGTDSIMMVIGNHDTRTGAYSQDWTGHAGKDAYKKYLAPFKKAWLRNVEQPEDAAKDGKCWWYRDYPVQHVRIIGLDSMSWGTVQTEWLEAVLTDAQKKGLSVLCAQHLPIGQVSPVSSFNSIDFNSYAGGYSGTPDAIKEAVDKFIANGGEFVCWFSGDSHFDFTGTLKDHPKQFSITFENGSCDDYWNDSGRVRGEKSQDSFNIVTIDTYSKLLKVVRIGNDHDRYLRSKQYFCVNYLTGELVSNR